ncbi:TrbI/VirB10 family protein [soil metagenome]
MTDQSPTTEDPVAGPPPVAPKEPAPGLSLRAARPRAVRLKRSVVQAIVMGGAVLVSGSLAWAFVVQPELRDSARAQAADDRRDEARGAVRPSETVTDQPASYDRLPEPRTAEPATSAPDAANAPTPRPASPVYRPVGERSAAPRGPSARDLAVRSTLFFAGQGGSAAGSAPAPRAEARQDGARAGTGDYGAIYNGHVLTAPLSPYELKAGAIIPAALLTAVDTSRSGPVIATVTQNVYDTVSGRHLVLPQGTRLIGRHEGESAFGDRRAFLTWDRLILPNGKSLILTEEPGVDAQGAIGVRGRVDRRLFPLLVGTLFAGAITTLGQAARDGEGGSGGLLGDAGDAAAIEGSQVGGRLVDRELQVRPSIRLDAGAPVRVMITRDLILEPYQP